MTPENVIIVVQSRMRGYTYNQDHSTFQQSPFSHLTDAGSGFCMLQVGAGGGCCCWWWWQWWWRHAAGACAGGRGEQVTRSVRALASTCARHSPPTLSRCTRAAPQLSWESEAFWLNPAGERVTITTTTFDYLIRKGVKWMLTRHIRDLNVVNPSTTLDTEGLAYALYLHDAEHVNMLVNVELVSDVAPNCQG